MASRLSCRSNLHHDTYPRHRNISNPHTLYLNTHITFASRGASSIWLVSLLYIPYSFENPIFCPRLLSVRLVEDPSSQPLYFDIYHVGSFMEHDHHIHLISMSSFDSFGAFPHTRTLRVDCNRSKIIVSPIKMGSLYHSQMRRRCSTYSRSVPNCGFDGSMIACISPRASLDPPVLSS